MSSLKYKTNNGYEPLPAMVVRKTNAENGNGIGTCSTSSGTALIVSLTNYELVQNGFVAVTFENDVPSGATLNINGKGAKPIYYKGSAITADTIKADDTALFSYDGTNYVLISSGGEGGTVDQTYDATSTNAQSGVAVASAISTKQNTLVVGTNLDSTPTANSNNPVTSGGVKSYVDPSLDVPIPFESDAVKAVVVEAFGGLLGGQNHDILGFRGEITYRQAYAVTNVNELFRNSTVSGSFNEFKYFKNISNMIFALNNAQNITSVIFPEGVTQIQPQTVRNSKFYCEFPSTTLTIGNYNFWGDDVNITVKLWATTPPSIRYNENYDIVKIMVPQSALATYQADAQWSRFGNKLVGF